MGPTSASLLPCITAALVAINAARSDWRAWRLVSIRIPEVLAVLCYADSVLDH